MACARCSCPTSWRPRRSPGRGSTAPPRSSSRSGPSAGWCSACERSAGGGATTDDREHGHHRADRPGLLGPHGRLVARRLRRRRAARRGPGGDRRRGLGTSPPGRGRARRGVLLAYAVAGRYRLGRERVDALSVGYLAVAWTAFLVMTTINGTSFVLLFVLFPQTWAMLPRNAAIGVDLAACSGIALDELADDSGRSATPRWGASCSSARRRSRRTCCGSSPSWASTTGPPRSPWRWSAACSRRRPDRRQE